MNIEDPDYDIKAWLITQQCELQVRCRSLKQEYKSWLLWLIKWKKEDDIRMTTEDMELLSGSLPGEVQELVIHETNQFEENVQKFKSGYVDHLVKLCTLKVLTGIALSDEERDALNESDS